jgi:hypothetical protein
MASTDEALIKFLTSTDWSKYISDREVKQHAEGLRNRVNALGSESKQSSSAGAKTEDEGDIVSIVHTWILSVYFMLLF